MSLLRMFFFSRDVPTMFSVLHPLDEPRPITSKVEGTFMHVNCTCSRKYFQNSLMFSALNLQSKSLSLCSRQIIMFLCKVDTPLPGVKTGNNSVSN